MKKEDHLNESEKVAKEHVLRMITKGFNKSCAEEITKDQELEIPHWYDEQKYKRGQKYFFDNLYGMTLALLYGLFSILADPKDLKILDSTGRTSTKKEARKRYMSTIGHVLCWYKYDLKPGTRAWKSLRKFRNIHANASKFAIKNGFGKITQTELSLVSFNFLGLQLNRPELLGIKHDNKKDREAYIHFWSVVIHMMGIEDEFNICLHPLETVEAICEICMRYVFTPYLQLETPRFEKMMNALMDGIGYYLPYTSYESVLFLVRRLIGVPGYHYIEDVPRNTFPKHYFSDEEYNSIKSILKNLPHFSYLSGLVLTEKIYLFDFNDTRNKQSKSLEKFKDQFNVEPLLDILDLESSNELFVTEIDETNFKETVKFNKFLDISEKDQTLIVKSINLTNYMSYKISKFLFRIFAELFIMYMTYLFFKKSKKVR